MSRYGFIGLGNMGGPMAANITAGGFEPLVYDKAGTAARAPVGAAIANSLAEVAAGADTVFISLPDGSVVGRVLAELLALTDIRVSSVIDLSTIGIEAARENARVLEEAGITYIDAPVSGGSTGARAATITVMWSGPEGTMENHQAVLSTFSKNQFNVGTKSGQGQALKLLNNFLTAVSMVSTSEAMSFALANEIDMKMALDVVNVSTGQTTASSDKFPNRILTGTYDAGFAMSLMSKDVNLYHDCVSATGTSKYVGSLINDIWNKANETMPGSDFTRIFEFINKS